MFSILLCHFCLIDKNLYRLLTLKVALGLEHSTCDSSVVSLKPTGH